MTTTIEPKMIHQGRNIKRFREMRGLKQEGLATELGEDWNQKKISLLEQKEEVEPELLEQLARVLKIPVDLIKEFDDQAPVNYYNTFHDFKDNAVASPTLNYHCNFNPLDELKNAVEEIRKLNEANRDLYERLLQSEREKLDLFKTKDKR
jgi:transcriptional regulator with XRE-family HTH domain